MNANSTEPSHHTTPTADEWLATWITIFGMFFILCIFLTPWLFFTEDPLWSGWGGRAATPMVTYVEVVPSKKLAPAPVPRRQMTHPPPAYLQVVKGIPVEPPPSSKEPPQSAQVLLSVPDLSLLGSKAHIMPR